MKLNIKNSLILYILTPVIIIYFILFIIIFSKISNYSESNIKLISNEIAQNNLSFFHNKFKYDYKILNTLKESLEEFSNFNEYDNESIKKDLLKEILISNKEISSVWVVLDNEISDTKDSKKASIYSRKDENIQYFSYSDNPINKSLDELFSTIKTNQKRSMIFFEESTNDVLNSNFLSLAVPLFYDNKFVGIVGLDLNVDKIKNDFLENASDLTANAYILTEDFKLNLFNNNMFDSEIPDIIRNEKVFSKVEANKKIELFWNKDKTNYYIDILPMNVDSETKNWALLSVTKIDELKSLSSNFNKILIMIISLSIILFMLIVFLIIKSFTKKIEESSIVLKAIADGKADQVSLLQETNITEITSFNEYINSISKNINKIAEFIEEIGKGNFEYEFDILNQDDLIGNSLTKLKKSLELSQIEELKRKEADERLNWATRGSAKFAEIIREHSNDIDQLSYAIISELVNYIDANQGGLFIINEDDDNQKHIELLASYAYNRKKMLEKRIPMGIGLVGRCIQERETIFMTKIPSDYLNITSGLGKENPGSLLIVPLIFHEEVFGVVELASFKEIENYKIRLVEQVGEGIASAISMVKINVRTAELLKETKIKSEQAASQEEEIRQNIEEMQASTDELNKKLDSVSNSYEALKSVINIAEFDLNGRVIDVNPNYLKIINKEKTEVIGKFQGSFSLEAPNVDTFKKFWRELKKGNQMEFEQVMNVDDKMLRINSLYLPVKDSEGEVFKVISFATVK